LAAAALAPIAHTQTPPAPAASSAAQRTAPLPGSEAALRKLIEGEISGTHDYSIMVPGMANAVRAQARQTRELYARFGALKEIEFKEAGPENSDTFTATYDNATVEYRVTLDAEGKMGANFRV